ncbi:MAG: leucine-rich repeat protein [Clostridia bacterium]|nr:leucine-rich repeat protein [Clostridia bacterium]MBQ8146786.1 leucine-rich repeat protein [Clostridia bacterium]
MNFKIYTLFCVAVVVLMLASCGGNQDPGNTPLDENTLTITFEYKNGTPDLVQTIEKGGVITEPASPEKHGYTFEGWYYEERMKWNFEDAPMIGVTLSAKWRPIEYQIEYVNAEGPRAYYTIEEELDLTEGTRACYEFFGWFEDPELTKPITKIEVGTVGNKKVYAKVVYQPFNLELQEDDTYKITRFNDTGATKITISNEYKGKKITVVGRNAFYDCTSLKSVTLSDEITTLEYGAFGRCNKVESFNLGNGLKQICEKAFYYCAGMTEIDIPSTVEYIEKDAFKNCNFLTINCQISEIPSGWEYGWNAERPYNLLENED